jgi:cytochrome c-type biogenesis protein CcmH/NrfG
MSDENISCPDCGFLNPAGSTSCWRCNYPLVARATPTATPAPDPPAEAAAAEAPAVPRPARPIRPRRPRPQQPLQMQLWLFFGAVAALVVIFTAVRGFHATNFKPVEGAKPEQQQVADQMRTRLERDSLDVQARITLADVLYDTGNWREAITHYTVAARLDPQRPATFVDLGVCYFNLGDAARAEELFRKALELNPSVPQALFNLGIVHEQRQDWSGALGFYQRAAETGPPGTMSQPLQEAIARVNAQAAGQRPSAR